jgi:hypothetical protein
MSLSRVGIRFDYGEVGKLRDRVWDLSNRFGRGFARRWWTGCEFGIETEGNITTVVLHFEKAFASFGFVVDETEIDVCVLSDLGGHLNGITVMELFEGVGSRFG